jgi:hypothetical protein
MASHRKNLVTIISAAILIGTEVFAVALAAGWALGGIFELGPNITYSLMGLFSLAGLYVMWAFVKMANRVEPIR